MKPKVKEHNELRRPMDPTKFVESSTMLNQIGARPDLLVSVRSLDEALAATAGGASIIDIKEPRNGPWVRLLRRFGAKSVRWYPTRRPSR